VLHREGLLYDSSPNTGIGISFIGRKFSEEALIGYAYAFEQATLAGQNAEPLYKPTIQLQDIQKMKLATTQAGLAKRFGGVQGSRND